jgi:hypothetical protein
LQQAGFAIYEYSDLARLKAWSLTYWSSMSAPLASTHVSHINRDPDTGNPELRVVRTSWGQ